MFVLQDSFSQRSNKIFPDESKLNIQVSVTVFVSGANKILSEEYFFLFKIRRGRKNADGSKILWWRNIRESWSIVVDAIVILFVNFELLD